MVAVRKKAQLGISEIDTFGILFFCFSCNLLLIVLLNFLLLSSDCIISPSISILLFSPITCLLPAELRLCCIPSGPQQYTVPSAFADLPCNQKGDFIRRYISNWLLSLWWQCRWATFGHRNRSGGGREGERPQHQRSLPQQFQQHVVGAQESGI